MLLFAALLSATALKAHEWVVAAHNPTVARRHPPRRVLFIGDSITDGGWGNSGGHATASDQRSHGDMNHIFGHGYMEMCAAHLMSTYAQRDYRFFNRGISGNTLYDLQARWQTDALDLNPDVVSILVGTNDIHEFLSDTTCTAFDFARWESTYRLLLDQLRQHNPEVVIIIGTPFVAKAGWVGAAPDFSRRQQLVGQLADITRRIARDYQAMLIPYDHLFKSIQPSAPRDNYWIWDGIHPTTAGHRRMADLWLKSTKKLFRR